MINKILKLCIFIVMILILANIFLVDSVWSGSATLSWDASTEPDLAGYKIYYGTSSRTGNCPPGGYSNFLDVGFTNASSLPSYTIPNLNDGETYYFSITAYDNFKNESCFSDEVSKTIGTIFFVELEGSSEVEGVEWMVKFFPPGKKSAGKKPLEEKNFEFTAKSTGEKKGRIVIPSSITIPKNKYDIIIKTKGYLSRKLSNVDLSRTLNVELSFPPMRAGDLNGDGVVNSLDLAVMDSVWFSKHPLADINKDNIVNSIDWSFLNKHWGEKDE